MGFAIGSPYWPTPTAIVPEQTGSVMSKLDASPPANLAYGDSLIGSAVPVSSQENNEPSEFAYIPGVVSRIAKMPSRLVNLLHRGEGPDLPFNGNRGVVVLQTHTVDGQQTPYTSRALTVRVEPETSPFASQFLGMAQAIGRGDG